MAVGVMLAELWGSPLDAQAQRRATESAGFRFHSGQSVTPYFEGWVRNPDGTFDLVFGYFNRNYEQEFAIPAGPDNHVDLGGPDAGQPTYFRPRRQRFVFRVRVPADFGRREVVWSVTANGRTERGYGFLHREMELTERAIMSGRFDPFLDDSNEAPSITAESPQTARAGEPLTLRASVMDDGLPLGVDDAGRPIPNPVKKTASLTVTWMQYGGPTKIAFGTRKVIPVTDGSAETSARFEKVGTYTIIATVSDGALSTTTPITIHVQPTPSAPRSRPR